MHILVNLHEDVLRIGNLWRSSIRHPTRMQALGFIHIHSLIYRARSLVVEHVVDIVFFTFSLNY